MSEKLNKVVRAAKNKQAPKKPPEPKAPVDPSIKLAEVLTDHVEKSIAAMELLGEKQEITVDFDTEKLGKAIGESLPEIVVNVPEREPRSYYATIDRRSQDDKMVGARIDPISE